MKLLNGLFEAFVLAVFLFTLYALLIIFGPMVAG